MMGGVGVELGFKVWELDHRGRGEEPMLASHPSQATPTMLRHRYSYLAVWPRSICTQTSCKRSCSLRLALLMVRNFVASQNRTRRRVLVPGDCKHDSLRSVAEIC